MQTVDNQLIKQEIELTEEAIKKAFLPFLRNFYKDRYAIQYGSLNASLDNVSESGIIADGKLTFMKASETDVSKSETFTCTYEASSVDKIGEVKFDLNQSYFLWDCVAFTALITTVFYVISFTSRITFLYFLGTIGNVGLLLGIAMIAFSTWFFSMRSWKKYRYIYAIEQFKRYFADEQWVVLGENVFHHTLDPNFLELKNQCIFNGFGLAIVDKKGETRAIVTPSRLGLYGKDRKMSDWITNLDFYKNSADKVNQVAKLRNKIPDPLTVLLNKIGHPIGYYLLKPIKEYFWNFFKIPYQKSNDSYHQFTGLFKTQKYVTLLCVLILGFFLKKILTEEMSKNLSEEEYWQYLDHRMGRANPEDEPGYVVDDKPENYNGIQKQYPEKILKEESEDDVQTIDLSSDADETQQIEEKTAPLESDNNEDNLQNWVTVASNSSEKPVVYSKKTSKDACTIVSQGKGWMIQDAFFKDKKLAQIRLEKLKHRGIESIVVAKSCLEKNELGYFVFIGEPIAKESLANKEKQNYQKALKRYGLEKGTLILKKL
jgi:hypothetical protein